MPLSQIVSASIENASVTPTDLAQPLTSGAAVPTVAGTSVDFTGIPSWVKRITVMFNGVSTNGTSPVIVQLGTSVGVEVTGYLGSAGLIQNSAVSVTTAYTTGFGIVPTPAAATVFSGVITINFLGSNIWIASGSYALSNVAITATSAGSKTLSATLDRVRITTVNGTDTFDAGSVNILYE